MNDDSAEYKQNAVRARTRLRFYASSKDIPNRLYRYCPDLEGILSLPKGHIVNVDCFPSGVNLNPGLYRVVEKDIDDLLVGDFLKELEIDSVYLRVYNLVYDREPEE